MASARWPLAILCGLLPRSLGNQLNQTFPGANHTLAGLFPRVHRVVALNNFNATKGRFGHCLKTAATANILGQLYNWSVYQPFRFRPLRSLLEPTRIGAPTAACPADHVQVRLAGKPPTRWVGLQTVSELNAAVQRAIDSERSKRPICLELTDNFRVHLHTLFTWEARGAVQPGVYDAVVGTLRRSLRLRVAPVPPGATAPNGALHFALHLRRDDRSYLQAEADEQYTLLASALAASPRPARVTLVTSSRGSEDVQQDGCNIVLSKLRQICSVSRELPGALFQRQARKGPSPGARAWPYCSQQLRPARCVVQMSSITEDFGTLLSADVFVMSNSGFSVAAAHLRDRGVVLTRPKISHFFPCPAHALSHMPASMACPYVAGAQHNASAKATYLQDNVTLLRTFP